MSYTQNFDPQGYARDNRRDGPQDDRYGPSAYRARQDSDAIMSFPTQQNIDMSRSLSPTQGYHDPKEKYRLDEPEVVRRHQAPQGYDNEKGYANDNSYTNDRYADEKMIAKQDVKEPAAEPAKPPPAPKPEPIHLRDSVKFWTWFSPYRQILVATIAIQAIAILVTLSGAWIYPRTHISGIACGNVLVAVAIRSEWVMRFLYWTSIQAIRGWAPMKLRVLVVAFLYHIGLFSSSPPQSRYNLELNFVFCFQVAYTVAVVSAR